MNLRVVAVGEYSRFFLAEKTANSKYTHTHRRRRNPIKRIHVRRVFEQQQRNIQNIAIDFYGGCVPQREQTFCASSCKNRQTIAREEEEKNVYVRQHAACVFLLLSISPFPHRN